MPEETADSLELLDWIVGQPWSNGRVGLWGISYEGTRALLTGGRLLPCGLLSRLIRMIPTPFISHPHTCTCHT